MAACFNDMPLQLVLGRFFFELVFYLQLTTLFKRMSMHTIKIKRIYEPAAEADGYRVLVDRLWPRGIKKTSANKHLWEKEVAPSQQQHNNAVVLQEYLEKEGS